MLEVNPRASRTVPFASKATGVNLVDAACRLAAGAPLAELGAAAGVAACPGHHVKAAVLPFARFPGADPVLGPGDALDRRGDGERAPTSRPRSRRPSAPPGGALPTGGRAFLSVRDARQDRGAAGRARARSSSASSWSRPPARRGALARRRHRGRRASRRARRSSSSSAAAASTSSSTRPQGRQRPPRRLRDPRGRGRRARAVHHDARGGARGRRGDRERAGRDAALAAGAACGAGAQGGDPCRVVSGCASSASRRSGRTRSCASRGGRSSPGVPGAVLHARGAGPRAAAAVLALPRAARRARVPDRPGRARHAALAGARARRRDRRLRPARQRLPARRAAARCSSAAASAIAPLPYLSEALERPPAVLGFRSDAPRRGGRARPERRGRDRPGARHRRAADADRDVLACGPEPMLEAVRALAPAAQLAWEAPMACGYGACYGCVVEIDGAPRAAVRGRAGPVLLLNASGCLDALTAPEVARALDAFVTKTVTPEPREGNPPVRIAETELRDAERDRAREPGPRPLPRRDAARAAGRSGCRSGSPSAASRRATTPRRARDSTDVDDRAEPLVPERRRGARVGGRDRRRLPRGDRPAALREALAGRLGHRRGRPRGRGGGRRRALAREHDARPRARREPPPAARPRRPAATPARR